LRKKTFFTLQCACKGGFSGKTLNNKTSAATNPFDENQALYTLRYQAKKEWLPIVPALHRASLPEGPKRPDFYAPPGFFWIENPGGSPCIFSS
jgi:hypothetical protein